ncbi:MAG: hypothetical protein M1840_003735 [Geoglossum simile]|nr:MAG: hypothetical protein M1840_003735 [Geoglossum simile]
MAVQSRIGTDAASDLAARMRNAFKNIECFVVVGIGGGVPRYGPAGAPSQIVLGDVVVSYPAGSYGGVVRYDFGAWTGEGLQIIHLHLLTAVNILRARHSNSGTKIPAFLKTMRPNIYNGQRNSEDQGVVRDRLFQDDYAHPKQRRSEICEDCCDLSRSQLRGQRGVEAAREIDTPEIHYGNIGSSNQLQISARTRNQLHEQLGVICFEMEGAGVIQAHPCLVIRGICDYSDSHKNKKWQPYAAATAAAYAKEFLEVLPASYFAPSPLVNQIKESGHPAFQTLASAPQAAFNALGKDQDSLCMPNTRVKVLQQIRTWVDGDDERYVFWLSGWAGTGKSTIARTIAREYYNKGCFIASFFFSRGGGDTTLKDQWNELVLKPLSKLEAGSFQNPLLIVIDALDECEKESDVGQVLHLLSDFRHLEGPHCRVFITSRPDIPVRHGFSIVPDQDHQDFVLHDISRSTVDDDIFTYLQHTLTYIQRKYYLQENWPGEEALRHLVQKAAGLFIWAATASRFIDDGGTHLCSDRLSDILKGDSSDIEPEEELNNIYTKVLDNSIGARLKQREKIKAYKMSREALGSIVTLFSPLPAHSIARMLRMPEHNIGATLGGLHSILDIPKDPNQPVRLHHPSLRDFLLSPQRCRDPHFWVDEKNAHEASANHCIQLMSQKLNKKDLCGLGDPGTKVAEVPSDKIQYYLPPELQYACKHWHLLYWIEALGWIRESSVGIRAIASLESTANSGKTPNLHAFIHDAKRFLLYNQSIIEEAPLQIYCCALLFAPQRSLVRKKFKREMLDWIKRSPQIVEEWSALVQTLEGHTGGVNDVVFSPDGKLVASTSNDGTIRVWDAATGAAVQTLKGHTGWISTVVFSPDSKLVTSASSDETVQVWDAATGAVIQTLKGHTSSVRIIVFSPDGKLVASASDDRTVRVWDAATGAVVQTFKGHTGWVRAVIFSPDSKLVASASDDRTVLVWDVATSAVVQTFKGHTGWVRAVIFSPDSKLVALVSEDKTIRMWDAATGAVQTLKGHTGGVNAIVFSPDSKLVASASDDRTIRMWDAAAGAAVQTFKGHTGWIRTVIFSPVNKLVASASDDRTIIFSPDSKLVASASNDGTVQVWDAATGAIIKTLKGYTGWISTVVFSPDSKLVASASNDGTVQVWDTATDAVVQILRGHTGRIRVVIFSPDSKLVASASNNSTIQVWDTATGAVVQTFRGHIGWISTVVFSPDSKLVTSSSNYETVQVWEAATGAVVQTLKGHTSSVRIIVFSPDGKLVASASDDRTVRVWDAAAGAAVLTLKSHTSWVRIVIFSPDSKLVASASNDGTVQVWDAATGAVVQTLRGHIGWISTVVFSPDSKLVASASNDGTVYVWDAATGAVVQMLKGHTDGVSTVIFSPDSKLVASASGDWTVWVWDAVTGAVIQTLKSPTSWVNAVIFSPDSKLVASASGDGTVRVWDTVTGAVVRIFRNCSTSTFAFSKDSLYLRTNKGSHIIDSGLYTTKHIRNNNLFIKDNWIFFGNTKLLWLPFEYRPVRSAFQDNLLALGLDSGIVKVIEFNIPEYF